MNENRRKIAAAVADEDGGAVSALRVLGLALRWSAEAIRQVDGEAGGTAALATVFEFDDALAQASELAAALPHLVTAARPGGTIPDHLARRIRELTVLAEQVAATRAEVNELRATEQQLNTRLAEHEDLRRRVAELRRLERLVVALDGLREQQEAVDDRLRTLRGRDVGVDEALRISSDSLVRLSEDQLALLSPHTRDALARATEAQRVLADEQSELDRGQWRLAEASDLLARVRAERGTQLAGLQRYAQATHDIAAALAELRGSRDDEPELSLRDVAATADTIAQRLLQTDNILRGVLADQDAADTDGRQLLDRTGD